MAKIGMPTMKLKTSKSNTRRAGSYFSVAAEALEERWGNDPDINREKTKENIYTGYRSAQELYDYSNQHIAELEQQLGHRLRSDTVRMIAQIIKPTKEYMDSLSREQQIKLLNDALDLLKRIVGEENIKSTVIHMDEQAMHMHVFWEPMTEDGRLCAKEVLNLKFYHRINTEMPKYLRMQGWAIEDAKMYDAQTMTEEEKQKHREEKKLMNRRSSDYKSQAEAKRLEELTEQIAEKKLEITHMTEAPTYEKYSEILHENAELKAEIVQKNTIIEKLKAEAEKYKHLAEEMGRKLSMIAQKAGARLMRLFGVESPEGASEYPSKEISAGIKEMTDGLKGIDSRQCRVIPDLEHDGKFRVVFKGSDGKYQTIKDGFITRELAEKFRKNLGDAALELREHQKEGIKQSNT